jgi:DNA-binding SARP family transcriptional activator
MEFRMLGALQASHDGTLVDLGRRRERCLLGVLLLEAGRAVRVDRLVELLWDDCPPRTVQATLRSHVSRLRDHLDPDDDGTRGVTLRRVGNAYAVTVNRSDVDALLFCDTVDWARDLKPHDKRAEQLRGALRLWQGPLLADELSAGLRARLEIPWIERRLAALELAIEAELAAGRHRELIGELAALTAEHPLRERFTALLMVAMYLDGRQAEAVEAFGRLGWKLREELGLDPNPEIRRLYQRIIEGGREVKELVLSRP